MLPIETLDEFRYPNPSPSGGGRTRQWSYDLLGAACADPE
ncbi:hypothetical protein RISK_000069 [Rhodopirellula islandica]|uniref:Uncharacterized protein n=1 Tax=Rhodopirellula islandica TaxID=595434 RepID=A0A0J1BN55_RHOIS|nr:hypothetical protein RISK_000069 [Rhodopirellula islandica]